MSSSDMGSDSEAEWEHQQQHAQQRTHKLQGGLQRDDSLQYADDDSRRPGKKDLSHVTCRFFRAGACTAGASCPFSHTLREQGTPKTVCKWFLKGSCRFGHKCANAHILPGQPASMDWKNKKAAKMASQIDAGISDSVPTGQNTPLSPQMGRSASQHSQHQLISPQSPAQAVLPTPQSGLSNIFNRKQTPISQHNMMRVAGAEDDTGSFGIAMSPMGIPHPAEVPLPGSSQPSILHQIAYKTKPFSYASAAAAASIAPVALTSPIAPPKATTTVEDVSLYPAFDRTPADEQQHVRLRKSPVPLPAYLPGSDNSQQAPTSNTTHLAQTSSTLSPVLSSCLSSRLCSSVPSELTQYSTVPKAHLGTPNSATPRSALGLGPQPSPRLTPLSKSQSQHHYPTAAARSLLLSGPPVESMHMSQSNSASGQRTPSNTNVFGTSPFGSNAIFLSSSNEYIDGERYMARSAVRTSGSSSTRHISPTRHERSNTIVMRNGAPSYATHWAHNQEGDDEEDIEIVEEELVPSSLRNLLTPDERARRDSRSEAASGRISGFWSPFDEPDTAQGVLTGNKSHASVFTQDQQYSRSVPAQSAYFASSQLTNNSPKAFSRAPGSPPVLTTVNGPPNQVEIHSTLSRTLLSAVGNGHVPTGRIAAGGFYRSGLSTPPILSSSQEAAVAKLAGTSLPQGLAAGLSRLHLQPAGTEPTGYTPSTSYNPSPEVSASPPGISNSSGASLKPVARPTMQQASSYGIRLPTLHSPMLLGHGQPPSFIPSGGSSPVTVSSRKITFGDFTSAGTGVHIGSPLARSELSGYSLHGLGSHSAQNLHLHNAGDKAVSEKSNEEDELVFEMDV